MKNSREPNIKRLRVFHSEASKYVRENVPKTCGASIRIAHPATIGISGTTPLTYRTSSA